LTQAKIYNLKGLDEALALKSEEVTYVQILSSIRFNFKEIEPLCFWDADNYSKINIGNGDNHELVLICWENNQYSKIHKHNNKEAFTYVLKGELTEHVFSRSAENLTSEKTTVLSQKDISSIIKKSNKEHQLINSYNGRSVSLHLYIK